MTQIAPRSASRSSTFRSDSRSAFRDWAAEKTSFPGEVAEAALAHTVANRVEAAYRRTDYLAKRKLMMSDWADFVMAGSK